MEIAINRLRRWDISGAGEQHGFWGLCAEPAVPAGGVPLPSAATWRRGRLLLHR